MEALVRKGELSHCLHDRFTNIAQHLERGVLAMNMSHYRQHGETKI